MNPCYNAFVDYDYLFTNLAYFASKERYMYKIDNLYDLSHTRAAAYLGQFTYAWEAFPGIKEMIVKLGQQLDSEEFDQVAPQVCESVSLCLLGRALHHRSEHGSAPLCFCPWCCFGGRWLRGGQLCGTEKCDPL